MFSQQSHQGSVTSTTPGVHYTYADGAGTGIAAKYVRLSKVTYPNGREVFSFYGGNAANDKLSRVYEVGADDNVANGIYDARYSYAGTGMIVREVRAGGTSKLDYDPSGTGSLSGLDRFGRVIAQTWSSDTSTGTSPTGTPTDRVGYGYDANSNRTARSTIISGGGTNGDGQYIADAYTYDGLNRLASWNSTLKTITGSTTEEGPTTATSKIASQDWSGLDALGNWRGFGEDADGNGTDDLTQTRTANAANEIGTIGATTGSDWVDPVYDAAGNMTTMPIPGDETHPQNAVYDAWNRMVKVTKPGPSSTTITLAAYEYDGTGRRIVATSGSDTTNSYYNDQWQLLETQDGNGVTVEQDIWSQRYIDALVRQDQFTTRLAGTIDSTFGGGDGYVTTDIDDLEGDDFGHRMVVQSDGKIVVVGWSNSGSGDKLVVVRYKANGDLDNTFGAVVTGTTHSGVFTFAASGTSQAYAVSVQADGKLLVVGKLGNDTLLLRLNANGTLDSHVTGTDADFGADTTPGYRTYNLGGTDVAYDMAVDAVGRIVVAGSVSSGADAVVARFMADGSGLDTTFASAATIPGVKTIDFGGSGERAYALALDGNGRIVITGVAGPAIFVARLIGGSGTTAGTPDNAFNTNGKLTYDFSGTDNDFANDVAVDAAGNVLVVGTLLNVFPTFATMFAIRLGDAGGFDTSFNGTGKVVYATTGTSEGASVVVQPDGRILIGGEMVDAGRNKATVWRYLDNGTADTSFGSGGKVMTAISADDSGELFTSIGYTWDGKVVVAGWAADGTTQGDFAVARYHADYGLDQTLYVQQDANFNVTSVVTAAGAIVERYRYTPYGERRIISDDYTPSATLASAYSVDDGFQGGRQDRDTSLISYRNRIYSSNTGGWLQRDPLHYVDGQNLYQAFSADPISGRDPAGLFDFHGHYLAILIVGRFLDLDSARTKELAYWTEFPDLLPQITASTPGVALTVFVNEFNSDVQTWLHSLHGGDPSKVRARQQCLRNMLLNDHSLKPWEQGFVLHALGDARSHVRSNGWAYGRGIGHALEAHGPDNPWSNVMAWKTYIWELTDIMNQLFKGGQALEDWRMRGILHWAYGLSQVPDSPENTYRDAAGTVPGLLFRPGVAGQPADLSGKYPTPSYGEIEALISKMKKSCGC